MMSAKLKCYISAPASFDLSKIENVLFHLNVDFHSFYDFSIGNTFSDLIRRKIRESDFVIAILADDSQNIIYELGVADGLRKPIFVLADKDSKAPYFLAGQLFYKTNFTDFTLIELALRNFISDINSKPQKLKPAPESINLKVDETTDFLMRISKLRHAVMEVELLKVIEDIFSSLQIQYESAYRSNIEKGTDLIIRRESLVPYFGNAIFVEVKAGNISANTLKRGEQQLMYAFQKTDAHSGIVLYLDRSARRFDNVILSPKILCFDLEDFVNGIASEGFDKLLINKRNRQVHGKF